MRWFIKLIAKQFIERYCMLFEHNTLGTGNRYFRLNDSTILSTLFLLIILLALTNNALAAAHDKSMSRSNIPQYFEENLGQYNLDYSFIAHTNNSSFAYSADHVAITLAGTTNDQQVSLKFLNANKRPIVTGENKRVHKINYLRANANNSFSNIPTYSQIRYQQLYPGIDVKFYFNQSELEYDFIVAPYIDPKQIAFQFDNADKLSLNERGQLIISVGDKSLIQKAPISYQLVNGERLIVESRYQLEDDTVGITLAGYDQSLPLIIDPIITFSSYFGGEWEDLPSEIETDSTGNIWVAGATATRTRITFQNQVTFENSALVTLKDETVDHYFDAEHGSQAENSCYQYQGTFDNDRIVTDYDAFIAKFTPDMEPLFTTYFGGCGNDGIRDMVIDSADNVYVVGFTLSQDFPVKFSLQSTLATSRSNVEPVRADGFYAKFDNDGWQIYTSYFGGDGKDGARGIAVDSDENIYITGYTHSTNLPTTPCIGGLTTVGCENVGGIDASAANQAADDFTLFADAFIAKIGKEGDAIDFLTYFGGAFDDWGQAIVLQSDGIVVAGRSASNNLPVGEDGYSYMAKRRYFVEVNKKQVEKPCTQLKTDEFLDLGQADAHVCRDIFLTKLSFDGTNNLFTTYLGGVKDDNISSLKVDSNDNLYLLGTTRSQGVRLIDGKPETILASKLNDRFPLYKQIKSFDFDTNSTSTIAVLSIFKPDASELIMSSFIGAEGDDAGTALAINEKSLSEIDVYLGGHTTSKDLFTKNAFQSRGADSDVFVVKLSLALDKFAEPFSIDPENPGTCNKDSCDLFDVKYSTFIGGENLDSLKGMSYSSFDDQLLLTGSTFSRKFPVTETVSTQDDPESGLKSEIGEVIENEYDPYTRDILYSFSYYPLDTFIMKIEDVDELVDLDVKLTNALPANVKKDNLISYDLMISNNSTTVAAKSVRLIVNFPHLSILEKLNQYISHDLDESSCILELRHLYCVIGDIAVGEEKAVSIQISARSSGRFVTDFTVVSMSADSDVENNILSERVNVEAKEEGGFLSFNPLSLVLLLILPLILRMSLQATPGSKG